MAGLFSPNDQDFPTLKISAPKPHYRHPWQLSDGKPGIRSNPLTLTRLFQDSFHREILCNEFMMYQTPGNN